MVRAVRIAGLAACGVLAGSLAACSASASAGSAGAPQTITLYNGQHEQTTQALVAAFQKQTGINVTIRSDGEAVVTAQILQEGSRSPADVIYTENSPPLEKLAERQMLAPVSAGTLASVPARYDSPARDWVGVSARVTVLVYNTRELSPAQLPRSALDLASPRWKGRFGFAPAETDLQPVITSITRADGQAAALTWLKGLKANAGSNLYPDNETVMAKVNSGQVQIALINNYYWYRLRLQAGAAAMHSAVAHLAPGDSGYVLDVSGAGVLASSQHKAAAQKFLAFLVSPEGQEIIAHSDSYEYPLRPGVAAAAALTPLSQLSPASDTIADLGDGLLPLGLLQQAELG
ncbi:MAG: extracellular solute-binding protein [Streptosporangiaceae bacterium]|nr:extracellular solute-binding protein [Streptosporangiaceae bacterium]